MTFQRVTPATVPGSPFRLVILATCAGRKRNKARIYEIALCAKSGSKIENGYSKDKAYYIYYFFMLCYRFLLWKTDANSLYLASGFHYFMFDRRQHHGGPDSPSFGNRKTPRQYRARGLFRLLLLQGMGR